MALFGGSPDFGAIFETPKITRLFQALKYFFLTNMLLKAGRARVKDLIFVGFLEISQAREHLSPGVAGVMLDGIIPSFAVKNVV